MIFKPKKFGPVRALLLCAVALLGVCFTLYGSSVRADIVLTGHRALYDIHMVQNRKATQIADIRGQMTYRFHDSCDGWDVRQDYSLDYHYADGTSARTRSTAQTWESKAGDLYTFSTSRKDDDDQGERLNGHAKREDHQGLKTVYQKQISTVNPITGEMIPQDTYSNDFLVGDVSFPTQHTIDILRRALQLDKAANIPLSPQPLPMMEHHLFDGHDLLGPITVSTFISPATTQTENAATNDNVKNITKHIDTSLLGGRTWLMRLAFYPREKDGDLDAVAMGVPDYEMSLWMNEHGIVHRMIIDYKDFSIEGRLKSLKRQKAARCKNR